MSVESLKNFNAHIQKNWIRMWEEFVKVWEEIVCKKWVISETGEDIKWRVFSLLEIIVESYEWNGVGFSKRIRISWFPYEKFNPKKFRKV